MELSCECGGLKFGRIGWRDGQWPGTLRVACTTLSPSSALIYMGHGM